jgi:hypothetical protein
MKFVASRSRNK